MQFTETVTRTITEISDQQLLAEYDKRVIGEPGSQNANERGELRAEMQRRMAERHQRRCYCAQQSNLGIGQALGLRGNQ